MLCIAWAVSLVLPQLKGRLNGMALRVPIPDVSDVYFTFQAKRDTSIAEIHGAMRQAAEGRFKDILGYACEPLVSADNVHNPFSAVYDETATMVTGKRLCAYDNEWAFSLRMLDTGAAMAKLDKPASFP
jgi:glyceraldehyde 3-phosphate dehydrogenase